MGETLENFNCIIDSIVNDMTPHELELSVKQLLKRDLSHGISAGQSDEIFDEIQKIRDGEES